MDLTVLGQSTENCMWPSMKFMCCRNWWLCVKLTHEQVGCNGTDGGTNSCAMYLLKILILEWEMGIFEAELWWCGDVMYEQRCFVIQVCVLFQLLIVNGDSRVHRNRCKKAFYIIGCNSLIVCIMSTLVYIGKVYGPTS